jgi:AMMECR1 domain-containing protein
MASIATAHGVFIKWSNKKTLVRVRGCASEVQRAKAAIQALISGLTLSKK